MKFSNLWISAILQKELENKKYNIEILRNSWCGRRGGLMGIELASGSSGPGSSPDRGHCVVFWGKTLTSDSASLHIGV